MFSKCKNTKKQGDVGVGVAVQYFSLQGYTVSIPLTDSQEYDLVVDIDDFLKRVQVKTTSYIPPKDNPNNCYSVSVTVKGGNRSGTGKIKQFDVTKIDYLFIVCENGVKYLIPTNKVIYQCFRLGEKFKEFII